VIAEIDPARIDERALRAAARALEAGQLVVFPTETVYGIGARPDLPAATTALFEVKSRPSSLSLPVLANDASSAWELGVPDHSAKRLAEAFWPGPLTIVMPRTDRTIPWMLGDQTATIAVRVPDHAISQALLDRAGPLAATSANPSGDPPLEHAKDLVAAFAGRAAVILVLPEDAGYPSGTPSTVVDCTSPAIRVLRTGAIGEDLLRRTLGGPAGSQTQ